MGDELKKVVRECLSSGIMSPYVIHYRPERITQEVKKKPHWTYVNSRYLGRAFAKAREKANPYPEYTKEEQPTFGEIRALSLWLYKKMGYERNYSQRLAGHATGEMTKYYEDGHEVEYMGVAAELSLTQAKKKLNLG